MGAMPGALDTDHQPPMVVPLRHFVVGLAFLLAAGRLADTPALARPGAVLVLAGTLVLVGPALVPATGAAGSLLPDWVPPATGIGGLLVAAGVVVFAANLLLVVHEHGPHRLDRVVLGRYVRE